MRLFFKLKYDFYGKSGEPISNATHQVEMSGTIFLPFSVEQKPECFSLLGFWVPDYEGLHE